MLAHLPPNYQAIRVGADYKTVGSHKGQDLRRSEASLEVLYYYITILPYYYITILLYYYITILLYYYITILLYYY